MFILNILISCIIFIIHLSRWIFFPFHYQTFHDYYLFSNRNNCESLRLVKIRLRSNRRDFLFLHFICRRKSSEKPNIFAFKRTELQFVFVSHLRFGWINNLKVSNRRHNQLIIPIYTLLLLLHTQSKSNSFLVHGYNNWYSSESWEQLINYGFRSCIHDDFSFHVRENEKKSLYY